MNRLPVTPLVKVFFFSLILTALTVPSWSSAVDQETAALRVGVAKVNITPPVPIPMSGYGNRSDVFQEIHDSLYAFAVVFDDGVQRAAMVTADLIGFSNQFTGETSKLIEQKTGISSSNVLLIATHNHGGPVNNTYGVSQNPKVADYVALSQQKIVQAVQDAVNGLTPAKIGSGKGSCSMNINRRAHFADGTIWLGRNPDGPCDKEVSVVRIDNIEGDPMVILVNWATHGTTGGQENYQITGDWPGATTRYVEEMTGGGVIAPITAGASGDINPIYGPNKRFRDIEAIGKILADEVIEVSESIETHHGGSVAATQLIIHAEGRKPSDNYKPNQSLEPADPVDIKLSLLKVGGIVFAGISGEVMTEIGMAIKEKSPYSHTVVVTHCNGSAGYLVTDNAYTEGGYEAMVTRTMPGTADLIIDNMNRLIRGLP